MHMRFFRVDGMLFAYLLDGIVAITLAPILILIALFLRKSLSHFELALSILLWALFACLYAISIPVIVDRSPFIYLLEKLEQLGGSIS